jgi:vitamin B12 transporter
VAFFLPAQSTFTAGAAYEQEHEHSSNASGDVGAPTTETDSFDASRHNIAYYGELLGAANDRVSYTLSGRMDDNSDYRRHSTYRLGANAALIPGVRIRASLSTAFNAPAFNQLRPTLFTVGSPGLRPERSRAAEVGLATTFAPDYVELSAAYFIQRFSDLIQFVNGAPPSFKGSFANLTAATSDGGELELRLLPARPLHATAGYTIVKPRVTSVDAAYEGSDRVGDALIRRPTHSGSVAVEYTPKPGATLGVAANYVGKRADVDFAQFPSPRVTLPAYTKVDLSGEYPLPAFGRGGLSLNARVDNVFNRKYEEVLNFATPRRTVFVGARATTRF